MTSASVHDLVNGGDYTESENARMAAKGTPPLMTFGYDTSAMFFSPPHDAGQHVYDLLIALANGMRTPIKTTWPVGAFL